MEHSCAPGLSLFEISCEQIQPTYNYTFVFKGNNVSVCVNRVTSLTCSIGMKQYLPAYLMM